jgi:serine/threonine-protein kinase
VTTVPDRLAAALADRYKIERQLGAGGMATVYLAQDIKHDRKVALKVLRPELAAVLGAERFVVEIKTTAALQHPHILPLFDSGQAVVPPLHGMERGTGGEAFLYYVMPYIEGETLRDKLNRETQFGVEEAVRIAVDVAGALDYAHRHGVIHRDIKPENILLHDGRPMVADFGIALALSAAAGGRMTETGLSLGTPHYMSPEQATAEKEITARSDVYSLGSVLYEMLAGQPPHLGGSAQQIIMKIVTDTARPVTELRKSVPPNVAAAVAKSLEKLPADRFASAAEFAAALGDATFATAATGLAATGTALPPYRRTAPLAVLAVVLLVVALWGWLRPRAIPVIRYGLALPPSQALLPGSSAPTPAPDGSFLIYHGPAENGAQLWIKRRDHYAATPIPGTLGAQSFALSPDGGWIVFGVSGQLKKTPVGGGAAVTILNTGVGTQAGVTWLDDGTIVFAYPNATGLGRISAAGGTASLAWKSDTVRAFLPSALPGGRGVLFGACAGGCTNFDVWALDLRTQSAHRVMSSTTGWTTYLPTGHVAYVTADGGLFAVPFDLGQMEAHGSPIPISDGLSGGNSTGFAPFHVSASGMLVMTTGGSGAGATYEMVWVDRRGRQTPVDTGWTFRLTALGSNHGWALSPDGSRLAVGLATTSGDDIWVKPLPRGPVYRVTYDAGAEFRPRWSADGRFVTFVAVRPAVGFYRRRADGTGTDSLLVPGQFDEGVAGPDGSSYLLRVGALGAQAGGRNIVGFRPGSDKAVVPVLATPYDEEAIALSPDGRQIAYQSDETGHTEIFVRPFPNVDSGKQQVSSGGGVAPLWSRDGRELFYLRGDSSMMAVRVAPGATPKLGEPTVLFRVPAQMLGIETAFYTPWDVARDGRFIMVRTVHAPSAESSALIVVENWLAEWKATLKK